MSMPVRKSSERKLLDAVDELTSTQNIASTPVDVILATASVSPATLYRGFRSKENLIAAALERRHQRWVEVWDKAIDAAGSDGTRRLLAVFDALDTFRAQPDGARWCAFLGAAADYSDPEPEIDAAIRRDTDHLRRTLAGLAVELPCADPDDLAQGLLLIVTGELAMRLRETDPRASSATARHVAEVFVAASMASARAE